MPNQGSKAIHIGAFLTVRVFVCLVSGDIFSSTRALLSARDTTGHGLQRAHGLGAHVGAYDKPDGRSETSTPGRRDRAANTTRHDRRTWNKREGGDRITGHQETPFIRCEMIGQPAERSPTSSLVSSRKTWPKRLLWIFFLLFDRFRHDLAASIFLFPHETCAASR